MSGDTIKVEKSVSELGVSVGRLDMLKAAFKGCNSEYEKEIHLYLDELRTILLAIIDGNFILAETGTRPTFTHDFKWNESQIDNMVTKLENMGQSDKVDLNSNPDLSNVIALLHDVKGRYWGNAVEPKGETDGQEPNS